MLRFVLLAQSLPKTFGTTPLTMKSIFFKLYSGLILILIVVALLGYGVLQYVNQSRYESYLVNNVGGTFSLMAAGIVRHEGEKRQKWIEVDGLSAEELLSRDRGQGL